MEGILIATINCYLFNIAVVYSLYSTQIYENQLVGILS